MNHTMASPSTYPDGAAGPPIEWLPHDWPPPTSDQVHGGAVWPPGPPSVEPPTPASPPRRRRVPRALAAMVTAIVVGVGVGYGVGKAMEAIGRNPEVIGPILVPLLIGLGFAEAIAIYALVIAFVLVGKV